MEDEKSVWLLEMNEKIEAIRSRIAKSDISLLELDHLLLMAPIIDNEIMNEADKEVLKSNFTKYIELTEWMSIHNPSVIRYGLRKRRLKYISPIRRYIFSNLKYKGIFTFRIDYTSYAIIFCMLIHIFSYLKLFYWDLTASIIVCIGAFLVGYINDKKSLKEGKIWYMPRSL